jgi:hypothetical protein
MLSVDSFNDYTHSAYLQENKPEQISIVYNQKVKTGLRKLSDHLD